MSLPKWVVDDLKRSGLAGAKTVQQLGIAHVVGQRLHEWTGLTYDNGLYAIPYPKLDGTHSGFVRYRFHPDDARDGMKYFQNPGTGVHFYFAPTCPRPWLEVAEDVSIPIAIIEGEKKAARGGLAGWAAIGIGGSSSFTTRKRNYKTIEGADRVMEGPSRPIDDFNLLRWRGRLVYVVYDSDYRSKVGVRDDRTRLVSLLMKQGALVKVIDLPECEDAEKVGLDDFLERRKNDAKAIKELEELAAPLNEEGYVELAELNERFCYVRQEAAIWSMEDSRFIDARKFVKPHLQNLFIRGYDEATGKLVKKQLGDVWLEWSQRATVAKITYKPKRDGEPDDDDALNVWRDTSPPPVKGSVKPFYDLLDHLGLFGELRAEFVKWCAYPVVNPGVRSLWATVFVGGQGSGKTLLAELILSVYGWRNDRPCVNTSVINGKDLHSTFNGQLCSKQFIVVNEIARVDRVAIADHLKSIIADTQITKNEKFQPAVELPNVASFMFTSNHANALKIERDERHYFIHRCPDTPILQTNYELWRTLKNWLEVERTAGANLRHHFMREVNLKNFNPSQAPTFTDAAVEMFEHGLPDVDAELATLGDDPTQFTLQGRTRTLFRLDELAAFVDHRLGGRVKVTRQSLINGDVKTLHHLRSGRQIKSKQVDRHRRVQRLWCFKALAPELEKLSDDDLLDRYASETQLIDDQLANARRAKLDGPTKKQGAK